jgi:plasmid stabilization system protein ParE
MRLRLIVTPEAKGDIDRNACWWAEKHSLEQALRWSATIYDQLQTLRQFPKRHALAAENDKFPFEVRENPVGVGSRPNYRAVYTVHEDTVYVLAIRRDSQDVLRGDDLSFDE